MRPHTLRAPLVPAIAPILEEAFDDRASPEEIADEIGQAAWIDPDTGTLAEEARTRIEEH